MARFRIRDKQGREYGPVDASELRYWIMDARLTADMLIQQEGLKDWYRAGDVPAIARLLAERAARIAGGHASSASGGTSAEHDSFPPDDDAHSYSRPEHAEAAPPSPPTPPPDQAPPIEPSLPYVISLLPERVFGRLAAAIGINLVISVGFSALCFRLCSGDFYDLFISSYIREFKRDWAPDFYQFRMLCTGAGFTFANVVFLAVFIGPPTRRHEPQSKPTDP